MIRTRRVRRDEAADIESGKLLDGVVRHAVFGNGKINGTVPAEFQGVVNGGGLADGRHGSEDDTTAAGVVGKNNSRSASRRDYSASRRATRYGGGGHHSRQHDSVCQIERQQQEQQVLLVVGRIYSNSNNGSNISEKVPTTEREKILMCRQSRAEDPRPRALGLYK